MLFFIAGILAVLIGLGMIIFSEDYKKTGLLPLIIGIILFIVSCINIVPTGYTGILTTFGKVEDRTISAGINFTLPWQNIVTMDNRTQKIELETAAFSSDIQQVDIQMSVNYNIDQVAARELYRTVGKNYFENVTYPRILENTKAIFSNYTAENLVAQRETLSTQIIDLTKNDMEKYGINIISIAIEDIDFTDAFTNAVEAKQVAAQNKLTAETQQAQKTMEQEAEAKRAIIAANAEAEQAKIQADATLYASQREAEANQKLAESLNQDLINYNWIKQWDGILPTTVLSDNGNYMIDLK